jgi:hypothetical protein
MVLFIFVVPGLIERHDFFSMRRYFQHETYQAPEKSFKPFRGKNNG